MLATVAAMGLVVAFLATLFNPAWTDEVFYVDPGACLAMGKGFTSNGWSELGHGTTWGLSNPGLPLLLAGWFKVFGFGQFSAHVFFYLVQFAGAVALVRWLVARYPLGQAGALAAVALCMMLHSLAGNSIFHARHDAFAPLLFAWFLGYAFASSFGWRQALSAFCFGPACVLFGLQFCGYFALASVAIFLWRRTRAAFMAGLCLAFGLVAGVLLLRWAYGEMGVWQSFLANRGENFGRAFVMEKFYVSKEFLVLLPACVGLVLTEGLSVRGWRSPAAVAGGCGVALLLGVPVVIQLIGLWQSPFSWMITLPLLLLILPVCLGRPIAQGGWFVLVVAGLFFVSCAIRLKELPLAIKETERRKQTISAFRRLADPAEVTLGSTSLYYELRASGQTVFWTYDRALSPHPAIAKDVRWLVLAEVDRPILTGLLGGDWEQAYVSETAPPQAAQGPYVILRRVTASPR
jgi:hypothetical protein